jgi:cellulose biosynthesis protein BcsQ
MALVNAAALLARRGSKVLVVDFDLEAPGLSTYDPFTSLTKSKGVVDFITEYIESSVAPDVRGYVVKCQLGEKDVWVMPAGQQHRDYAARLNSVDWQSLYLRHDGFLFFEDLKQQWRNHGFDYVLVDSRTGHTDVGGICTRQLPDAVVAMFFPNDQNLIGLENVVKDIREEPRALRPQEIFLHFCASNIPDLDDEKHILERKLSEARRRLAYEQSPVLIHHYNSLSFLEQSVFVLDRPESKLAIEYTRLVERIVSRNLEDRNGALATLKRLRDGFMRSRGNVGEDVSSILETILEKYSADGEIAWLMAQIFSIVGDLDKEADRLTVAIQNNVSAMTALRRRAAIFLLQNRKEDALADLQTVLGSETVAGFEWVAAVELLREIDANWISAVNLPTVFRRLDSEQILRLAEILISDRRGSTIVIPLMRQLMSSLDRSGENLSRASNLLVLAMISSRHYEAAMEVIAHDREDVLRSNDVVNVFNFAMAEWGVKGGAPKDLMMRVVELSKRDGLGTPRGVNHSQCYAIAYKVCGLDELARGAVARARSLLPNVPGRIFSSWRYLEVGRGKMAEDLDALEEFIDNRGPGPLLFRKDEFETLH